MVLIPGSGEFAYETEAVTRIGNGGERAYENIHTMQGGTDWRVSLDQLESALPAARSVSLVVSWFGTDLRAGQCEIRPGVDLLRTSRILPIIGRWPASLASRHMSSASVTAAQPMAAPHPTGA